MTKLDCLGKGGVDKEKIVPTGRRDVNGDRKNLGVV